CILCLISMTYAKLIRWIVVVCVFAGSASSQTAVQSALCVDGFCIGQSIKDVRFSQVEWIVPKDARKDACNGVGCRPEIAFRGYSTKEQKELANAVSLIYGLG